MESVKNAKVIGLSGILQTNCGTTFHIVFGPSPKPTPEYNLVKGRTKVLPERI